MKVFEQDNHKHGPEKVSIKGGIPNYIKFFITLASLALCAYIIILGSSVIGPLLSAFILALLLKPLAQKFEIIKMPRSISSMFAILIVFIVIVGLSLFFSAQIANIASELDTLELQFNNIIDKVHQWAEETLDLGAQEQMEYLKKSLGKLLENSSSIAGSTITATANFFTGFFLFMISLFFFLYYRSFLVSFLYRIFSPKNHDQLGVTLQKVEGVVRNYILGLFFVILIIAVLNTIGLFALGIKHAVFFGALSAILTIIPYAGVMIGSLLPAVFALVTKDSLWYPVGVIAIFAVVQFLEGNFITPNIVGNQVSVNPFAAILGLLLGGMMLGATGMVFAIPVLAIVKVIFDSIESARPIGYLIGSPPNDEELYKKRRKRAQSLFKKGV